MFELYKKNSEHNYYASTDGWYVRVLWGGQPMQTSTPLGTLDMIPVDSVLDCMFIPSWIFSVVYADARNIAIQISRVTSGRAQIFMLRAPVERGVRRENLHIISFHSVYLWVKTVICE